MFLFGISVWCQMIVDFHSEKDTFKHTLLILPESRQERRSVELLYQRMLWYAESVDVDSSILYLRSDGILEIGSFFPSHGLFLPPMVS